MSMSINIIYLVYQFIKCASYIIHHLLMYNS